MSEYGLKRHFTGECAREIVSKRHSFKVVKTRTYYAGEQGLVVQANGAPAEMIPFVLHADEAAGDQ